MLRYVFWDDQIVQFWPWSCGCKKLQGVDWRADSRCLLCSFSMNFAFQVIVYENFGIFCAEEVDFSMQHIAAPFWLIDRKTGIQHSMDYFRLTLWGAGMVQYRAHLPPTKVPRVWLAPYLCWVCCWLSPCSKGFSLGATFYLPPQKLASPNSNSTRIEDPHENQLGWCGFLSKHCNLFICLTFDMCTIN